MLSKLITRLNAYSSNFIGATAIKCEQQLEQLEKSPRGRFSLGSGDINTQRSFDNTYLSTSEGATINKSGILQNWQT